MNKVKDIIGNISKVKASTWVRLVLMVITVVNMILAAIGKPRYILTMRAIYDNQRCCVGYRRCCHSGR